MEEKITTEKSVNNDNKYKTNDCTKYKKITSWLVNIGLASAVAVTLNAYIKSQLNMDYLIAKFIGLPTKIVVVTMVTIGVIKIVYNSLKYGELDSLEDLLITRKHTFKNTLQAAYLILILAIAPLAGYVCGLGAVLALTALYNL